MTAPRSILFACLVAAAAPASATAPTTLGAGVTLAESTPIVQIAAKPADFEGKTVRVEGLVRAVCTHMGCWMSLAPTDAADAPTVRFKVEDGVIVFPVSAKGRRAAAQGMVERIGGGDAESKEAAAEHAKAEGAKAASTSWQIRATGAVIY
jgi:hypothetical protein